MGLTEQRMLCQYKNKPEVVRQEKKRMAQKETLSTRVGRLEELAETLLRSQIRTDEVIRELRKEQAERDRITDERIGKLVSAIGELISRMPPVAPKVS
jgi:DNA repair exonuclease SbcCD nuclease subunit